MRPNLTQSFIHRETLKLQELSTFPQKQTSYYHSPNVFIETFKKELQQTTEKIIDQMNIILDEVRWYGETYYNEEFVSLTNEKIEDTLKRLETHYDKTYETHCRLQRFATLSKDIQKHFNHYQTLMKQLDDERETKNESIGNGMNFLLEKIKTSSKSLKKENGSNWLKQVENDYTDNVVVTREYQKHLENEMYEKELEYIHKSSGYQTIDIGRYSSLQPIVKEEIEAIRHWTGKNLNSLIFNSTSDDWKVNSSVFDRKVLGRRNLLFIIDDYDGNRFGGYVTSQINSMWISNARLKVNATGSRTYDGGAFVFTLRRRTKLTLQKFETIVPSESFTLCDAPNGCLFHFGDSKNGRYDIRIHKQNAGASICQSASYNYKGRASPLRDWDEGFTPARILVYQLS